MKDKNLPDDIKNKSLTELTNLADNLIDNLERQKNIDDFNINYQKLLILNALIQKKIKNISKEISEKTKDKINKILKNEK
tara:strand:+ start:270 stop:509 length:240 start_codon:yes stop_codon:yes gene_type:complete